MIGYIIKKVTMRSKQERPKYVAFLMFSRPRCIVLFTNTPEFGRPDSMVHLAYSKTVIGVFGHFKLVLDNILGQYIN